MKTITSITDIENKGEGEDRYVTAKITYGDGTTQELAAATRNSSESDAETQRIGLERIVGMAVWFATGKYDAAMAKEVQP